MHASHVSKCAVRTIIRALVMIPVARASGLKLNKKKFTFHTGSCLSASGRYTSQDFLARQLVITKVEPLTLIGFPFCFSLHSTGRFSVSQPPGVLSLASALVLLGPYEN